MRLSFRQNSAFLAAALMWAAPAVALDPPGLPSPQLATAVSIEAKEVATGQKTIQRWANGYGQYDKDFYRTKQVSVSVNNVSRIGAGDCELQIFFLAKKVSDGTVHVHHSSKERFALGAMASTTKLFTCPGIAASVQNYGYGERWLSGAKFYGWLVILSRDGTILGSKGSSSEQQALARDRKIIDTFLEEGQKSISSGTRN
jgi:hypothetical protein